MQGRATRPAIVSVCRSPELGGKPVRIVLSGVAQNHLRPSLPTREQFMTGRFATHVDCLCPGAGDASNLSTMFGGSGFDVRPGLDLGQAARGAVSPRHGWRAPRTVPLPVFRGTDGKEHAVPATSHWDLEQCHPAAMLAGQIKLFLRGRRHNLPNSNTREVLLENSKRAIHGSGVAAPPPRCSAT